MQPEIKGTAHDGSGALRDPNEDRVPPIERMANDIAERMQAMGQELERQSKLLRDLLQHVGIKTFCTGANCGQPILKIWHVDSQRQAPYNLDGTSHFATCPDREQFRRPKRR